MKYRNCPVCEKGELENAADIILDISGYVFVVKGERCSKCGEEFPSEEETTNVINASKKLGVWPEPLKLFRSLSKSGRNLTLRIPADIERQMNLHAGEELAISKIGNKLIVEPIED